MQKKRKSAKTVVIVKPTPKLAERENVLTYTKRNRGAPVTVMTDETRAALLNLMRDGATVHEARIALNIKSNNSIFEVRERDASFAKAYREAQVEGCAAMLDTAQAFVTEQAATLDPDFVRVAEMFARTTSVYAEKVAPREYGPLVKLAGADGGALQVIVADYRTLKSDANDRWISETADGSHASVSGGSPRTLSADEDGTTE